MINKINGVATIENTRIQVWTLVSFKLQGLSDEEILSNYYISKEQLEECWKYYQENKEEIDLNIYENSSN